MDSVLLSTINFVLVVVLFTFTSVITMEKLEVMDKKLDKIEQRISNG